MIAVVICDHTWLLLHVVSPLSSLSDVEKIRAGIGDKMAVFLFSLSSSLTGFIIAFIFSWKLTLVTLTLQPVLAFMSGSIARVCRVCYNCIG